MPAAKKATAKGTRARARAPKARPEAKEILEALAALPRGQEGHDVRAGEFRAQRNLNAAPAFDAPDGDLSGLLDSLEYGRMGEVLLDGFPLEVHRDGEPAEG